MNLTAQKADTFALVTNRIIELFEKGIVPWKKSWTDKGPPINLVTCKSYRSINLWLLNALDYDTNIFLTAHQAKELGGWVRQGEEPHLAVYWKWVEDLLSLETPKKLVPTFKHYYLFHISQCAGIPDHCIPVKAMRKKYYPIKVCKEVVDCMPNAPKIRHRRDKAYYQPVFDFINMPSPDTYINDEYYYATLFNRLIYSTGHESRLNRKAFQTVTPKDFSVLSLEELTADMGACYLSSYCGIDTWNFENRMEYIHRWLEKFRNDSRCLVHATIQAQKAVEYILSENHHPDPEEWMIEDEHFQTEAYE